MNDEDHSKNEPRPWYWQSDSKVNTKAEAEVWDFLVMTKLSVDKYMFFYLREFDYRRCWLWSVSTTAPPLEFIEFGWLLVDFEPVKIAAKDVNGRLPFSAVIVQTRGFLFLFPV